MTISERIRVVIDTTADKAADGLRGYGNDTQAVDLKTKALNSSLGQQAQSLAAIPIPMLAIGAGAAVAATAVAKFALDGVGNFVDLASEVRNFQRATGMSAEESSRWIAVADDMEIPAASLEKAVFKLGREIGQGGTSLSEFGVQIATNADGTTNMKETVLDLADAYVETKDPAERAAMVQAAFGRGGKELIPILEQGRKGLEKFWQGAEAGHQILSQDDIDKAREYELAMDALGDATSGVQRELGSALVPSITSGTNALAQMVGAADAAAGSVGGLGSVFEFGMKSIPVVGNGLSMLDMAFGDSKDGADKFAEAQKRVDEATKAVAAATLDHGGKSRQTRAAQNELTAAQSALEGQTEKVSTALGVETQQHKDLALAADQERQAKQALVTAQMGFVNAALGVTQANQGMQSAATSYAEAQDAANKATGTDAPAAQQAAASAYTSLQSSVNSYATAVVQKAQQEAAATGQTLTAKQQMDIYNGALYAAATSGIPGAAGATAGLVGELQKVVAPPPVTIAIDTADAHAKLRALRDDWAGTLNVLSAAGDQIARNVQSKLNGRTTP